MSDITTPNHTPTPWVVIPDEGNGFYVRAIELPEETIVARCVDYPHMGGLENGTWEAKANATLIAEAPNMLAVLKSVNTEYNQFFGITDSDEGGSALHDTIRETIAKAEGRNAND